MKSLRDVLDSILRTDSPAAGITGEKDPNVAKTQMQTFEKLVEPQLE